MYCTLVIYVYEEVVLGAIRVDDCPNLGDIAIWMYGFHYAFPFYRSKIICFSGIK